MTRFQKNALDKIRHMGGSIFYASDKRWTYRDGERVMVLNPDGRTEGFIGWPTIQALISAEKIYHKTGNEYALTSRA